MSDAAHEYVGRKALAIVPLCLCVVVVWTFEKLDEYIGGFALRVALRLIRFGAPNKPLPDIAAQWRTVNERARAERETR